MSDIPTALEAGDSVSPLTMARRDLVLEIDRVFDAPRALVFRVWSTPDHVVRWWGPKGLFLSHCEMDFRKGGEWRFCMQPQGRPGHWIHGQYREIQLPERLVFTYINDADGHEMLVEMDFLAEGEKTRLHFRQAEFLSVAERDGHRGGWSQTFEILADYLRLHQAGKLSRSPRGWRQGEGEGITADLPAE